MDSFHRQSFDLSEKVRRHAPCLLVISLLTLAIYGRTASFDFLTNWDDPQYITLNPTIRGLTWQHVAEAFTRPWVGNYAPLHIISYMVDHQFWGMNPAGFHLTSLILHGINGMLLYALATRISGRQSAGLVAALIFIAHPVQVESVAWLSQRKTLLSLFFFLASFLAYLSSGKECRHNRLFFTLAIGAFIASLLTKSVAVVLPLCLVIYEITIAGTRADRDLMRRLVPFVAAAGLMALLTLYTQQPETGGGRIPYHGGSPWATLLTMIPVMVGYLKMLLFPVGLSALYFPPIKTVPDAQVLAAILVLTAILAAGIAWYRRTPPLFFWYALFFVPLLPVSQIIPLVTLINDRYLYFPMVGAAGLAGHLAARLLDRVPVDRKWPIYGTVVCLTALLAVASFLRTGAWRNSIALWSDAAGKNPGSRDIAAMLAEAYKNAGRLGEAGEAYRRLFAHPGDFADPRHEREALKDGGLVFMDIGSFEEAERLLLRLTEKFPDNSTGFAFLASCYTATGKKTAAEAAYRRALQIAPDNPQGMIGLASLFLDGNDADKAAPLLARAVAVGAEGPDLRVALARFAVRKGDRAGALAHLEKGVALGLVNPARLGLLPDFTPLRNDPRFIAITAGTR